MDIYGTKSASIPQKSVLLLLETVIIIISYYILFEGWYQKIFHNSLKGNEIRHWILFSFNIITFLRMIITVSNIKRKIPWEEVFSIPIAFSLYYVGFALLGFESKASVGFLDYIGIFLFLTGGFLNTYSEFLRRKWKKHPENKGHLYTQGLFKYSRHINYFGDLVWVTGYAFVTHNIYAFIIPLLLFAFFKFFNIPQLEKYLENKYKDEFIDYKSKVKSFIPFVL